MNLWDIINIPMSYVLKWCNALVGNQYILALFLFAIVVEILLIPFGIKQQKNSIRQARLKPKEMAIRKKYAGRDDRQTQQLLSQEIQEMYQKENASPLSGCLPMLIQFPILIALYNIVVDPLKYICGLSDTCVAQLREIIKTFPQYADADLSQSIRMLDPIKKIMTGEHGAEVFEGVEGFAANIPNVEALPNLSVFGAIELGDIPNFTDPGWILLVPFLTFIVYFLSMKFTRKLSFQPSAGANDQAMGCSNKMMDFTMPLLSVFISFSVPAAIGVYWIFKSILGTVKQFILHKTMPLPRFTEEDYKAAEREVGVRSKAKERRAERRESAVEDTTPVPKSERVGSVRSLHHIDDEDFEDTRERAERAKAAMQAAEEAKNATRREKNDKISLGDKDITIKNDTASNDGKKKAKKAKGKQTSNNEVTVKTEENSAENTASENAPATSDESSNENNT